MYEIESGILVPEEPNRKCSKARCFNEASEGKKLCKECLEKNAAQSRKFRENNPGYQRNQGINYYAKNKETMLAKNKEYRIEHKEEIAEREKKDYYLNREDILLNGKLYRQNNKQHVSERDKKHRKEHLEVFSIRDKKRRDKNPELFKARNAIWRKNNPDKIHALNARYRARKKASSLVVYINRQEIFERDNYICQLCGIAVKPDVNHRNSLYPSLDHIVPLSKGGTHEPANLQCAHLGCNISKGNRIKKGADYVPKHS